MAPVPLTRHNLQSSALGKMALSRTPHLRRRITSSKIRSELREIDATGVAWNREESGKGVIALTTWGAGKSPEEPLLAVAWPAFRFTEAKAQKALEAIRNALTEKGMNSASS